MWALTGQRLIALSYAADGFQEIYSLYCHFQRRSASARNKRYSPPPGTIDEKEIQRHRGSRTSLNSEGEFIPDTSVSIFIQVIVS